MKAYFFQRMRVIVGCRKAHYLPKHMREFGYPIIMVYLGNNLILVYKKDQYILLRQIININVLGETVNEFANPGATDFTIDLSKLPPGTYFARFSGEGEVVTRKIIKE